MDEQQSANSGGPKETKMHKPIGRIILFVFLGVLVLAIAICALVLSISVNAKKDSQPNYVIGGDKVPSVYQIVGNRNVNNLESHMVNGYGSLIYTYTDVNDAKGDMQQYDVALKKNFGFVQISSFDFSKESGSTTLAAVSKTDRSNLISVHLEWSGTGYKVTVQRYKGKLQLGI